MRRTHHLKTRFNLNGKGDVVLQAIIILCAPILGCLMMNIRLDDIGTPWGFGDLLSHYQYQDAIWKKNELDSPHYGYPGGQDLRIWPFLDYFQSLLVGTYALFFPIFTAVNLTIISSFLFSAVVLNSFGKIIGLRKISTYLLIFAGVTLPWWPGRVQHFDYLFILVALLPIISYLKILRDRRISLSTIFAALVAGLCGPYLVAFSLISGFIALLSSVILKTYRDLFLRLSLVLCVIPTVSYFLAYAIFISKAQNSYPGLSRNIIEAVHLSGYALLPFLPLPNTSVPILGSILNRAQLQDSPTEATWSSNYGSLLLLASGILVVGTILLAPRIRLRFREASENHKQIIWILSLQLGIFFFLFLRGGLGLIISGILPELRAWNRITPIIQIIVVAIALLLIQILWSQKYQKWLLFTFSILVILQADSVRESNLIEPKKAELATMQKFIKDFSPKIPKNCAILQLPRIPYPLNGDIMYMQDYDHFLVSILDRDHKFSYGSARLDMVKRPIEIDSSSFKTFCGIYLDSNAYENVTQENLLRTRFGNPIISADNRYKFFVNPYYESTSLESEKKP